jgi:hypothetical protein
MAKAAAGVNLEIASASAPGRFFGGQLFPIGRGQIDIAMKAP